MSTEIRHATIFTNGIHLHVAEAGPPDGPPVILLHGFPEPWSCWKGQIGPLAEAGFRVLAPDQRGYGTSDKPPCVADYALDRLADDILGLIEATGHPRVALVGHDWGSLVAWWVAVRHPDRLERLAILNAPHPIAFRRFVRTHPRQLLTSSYMLFFQLPWLPEWSLRRGNWQSLARGLRKTSRAGAFSEADLDEYRRAWSEPGAMTSMLNWYRALFRHAPPEPKDPRVHVPTLLIWGAKDAFIDRRAADASLEYCDRGRLQFLEDATHWLHHEEPERVHRLLLGFLRDQPGA